MHVQKNQRTFLAKYSGVSISDVDSLFRNPKANKNDIVKLIKISTDISKRVADKVKQLTNESKDQLKQLSNYVKATPAKIQSKKLIKASQTKLRANIKAIKDNLKAKINSDPFVLLNIEKPSINLTSYSQSNVNYNTQYNLEEKKKCKDKCENKCEDKLYKKIKCYVKSLFPCAPHIPISSLPFTCDRPGTYCLTQNLFHNGSTAAITVASSGVDINFDNFSITLPFDNSIGIYVENVNNINIYGGQIIGGVSFVSQIGIYFYNNNVVNVHDMTITNISIGISADAVNSGQYENLSMAYPLPSISGYDIESSAIQLFVCNKQIIRNVNIDDYSGIGLGVITLFSTSDVTIENVKGIRSSIFDDQSSGIYAAGNTQTNIKNIQLTNYVIGINMLTIEPTLITIDGAQISSSNQSLTLYAIYIAFFFIIGNGPNQVTANNIQVYNYYSGIEFGVDTIASITNASFYADSPIVSSSNFAIDASYAINIDMKNISVFNYYVGIAIYGGLNYSIENSQMVIDEGSFDQFNRGIDASFSTQVNIKNTQMYGYFKGISAQSSAFVVIDAAQMFGYGYEAIIPDPNIIGIDLSPALPFSSTTNVIIKNCDITQCTTGILFDGCNDLIISDSIFSINYTHLSSNGGTNCKIDGNTIYGAAGTIAGIYMLDVFYCDITNNLISSNSVNGILMDGTSEANNITDNRIINNSGYGLQLNASTAYNVYTKNTFIYNNGSPSAVQYIDYASLNTFTITPNGNITSP